jgi:hypothetical protein
MGGCLQPAHHRAARKRASSNTKSCLDRHLEQHAVDRGAYPHQHGCVADVFFHGVPPHRCGGVSRPVAVQPVEVSCDDVSAAIDEFSECEGGIGPHPEVHGGRFARNQYY